MTSFRLPLVGFLVAVPSWLGADVLLSQYYEGSSNNKWLELANTAPVPVSLDGYVLASFNNAQTEAWKLGGAVPTNAESLDGFSIPANGYLLVGNAQAVLPAYASADLTSAVTFFNGDDSVVLYDTSRGAVGDIAAIVDAIGFTDAGSEGGNTSFHRISNEAGYNLAASSTVLDFGAVWEEKSNTEVDEATPEQGWYLRNFASSASNALSVELTPAVIPEDGGTGVVDVTVSRTGSTAAALSVSLASSDETESVIPDPVREIPAGAPSATFAMAVDAVDDMLADGTQVVRIEASATGFLPGSAELTVTDDGDVAVLAINEVLADPPTGAAGDANRDGVRDSGGDEFVELVNLTAAPLDISFWELHEGSGLRHIFPPGTILEAHCAVVVFGGGSVDFLGGSSLYQLASNADNGGLSLNNGGDTVTVYNELQTAIASLTYGAEGGNDESLTRDPDVTGSFAGHGTTGDGSASFSPGTRTDGSPFCPAAGALTVAVSAPRMSEMGGMLTATISRAGSLAEDLEVIVRTDDASEAVTDLPFDTTFIPAGAASVEVTVNAVDDVAEDGSQLVTITARAVRYELGSAVFEVTDEGDGPFGGIVINEFHYDPAGDLSGDANGDGIRQGSEDEFVELLNVSGGPFNLSGYQVQDAVGVRHVFPDGTILADGQAIVVFGGGSPTGDFGGAVVQLASTGFLGLNNTGDAVILAAPDGSELLRADYDGSVPDESITRDPDGTGDFVAHSLAAGSNGALFSPGRKVDGSPFAGGGLPAFVIGTFAVDRSAGTVTLEVGGLLPGLLYDLETSPDLGGEGFWRFVQLFSVDDGEEVSPGVYRFTFTDSAIGGAPTRFYRVALY